FAEADLRLYVLFQMLHGLGVDRALYEQLFGVDTLEEHEPIWAALFERGWAALEPEKLALVDDGIFYTPLIQGLLAAGRQDDMRRGRPERRVHRAEGLATAREVLA